MNKTMTNAVAQSICLILLLSLAKGTELNHFSIMDLECIDGNVTVSMICSVPKPQNMIIIFKDGTELTRCTTYSAPPYMHCTNSTLKDVIASSTVMNYSMIFQIESAKTDFLIGKWVCQNGGPNDPSWSLLFPNITCFKAQGLVKLSGNQYVKRLGNLRLNCSSDNTPIANQASIHVDGKSYTTITLLDGECVYGDFRTKCTPGVCVCSNRGLWYSYTYTVVQDVGVLSFTCLMTFEAHGSFSDSIRVNIIGKPIIDISKAATCKSSSAITLYCIINTGFPLFGFYNWMHSRHGTIIRYLKGEKMHTKSLLKFNSCSHDATDDYTCEAYNEYGGNITFANKTVSLFVYGPPIIKSEETVTCNNSSVTLSCTIKTVLPVYGFNPWIHYFNRTYFRRLNGSVLERKSILEVETCSYQNAGEYICTAWNKYGDTTLVANKTSDLVVNASPVIISSHVIREQQTTLSATFYSSSEMVLTWEQSNQTLTNSTDWLQTLDRNKIELILYNKSIEWDGYTANLSIRFSLVGEYVLRLQNTFGETRLFFEVTKLSTQALTASFDLRTVVFCIIAIGIFFLSTAGTVIMSKGIRRKNVIHIIGPHERCPTIPIYHTAPSLDNTQNVYAIPETGYLQVTNEQYELDHFQDTEHKVVENYTSRYMSCNYDEIDV